MNDNFSLPGSVLILFVMFLLLTGCPDPEGDDPAVTPLPPEVELPAEAEISEDHTMIIFRDEQDSVLFEYSNQDWQEWALENFDNVYDEPIEIGDEEMRPERFDRFGFADLAPNREKAIFFVTTYAILTDITLVGVIDTRSRQLEDMIPEDNHGMIGELAWSPDQTHIAYTLATARAGGDFLAVDDLSSFEKSFLLSEDEIIEASGTEKNDENREPHMPHFRDVEWVNEDQLQFSADTPEEENVRWSISHDGTGLKQIER